MREYPYQISVVMAVYNVEPFIREAVDSVIAQDIGFENIQLILVDDGSPDGSGAICDEYAQMYPENVTVIHKENGGVSSARNAGLEVAQGELVNFLDADDKLSADAMRLVFSFYLLHKEEADVFSIPLYFFDAQTGPHILNRKYKKGSRVVDLDKEWDVIQLQIGSCFIKASQLLNHQFDVHLSYAEDAQLLQKILIQKHRLGLISNARYWYRRRSSGAASAIQSSQQNKKWYLPYMKYFQRDTILWSKEHLGYVPKFVQYTLMYDLQWRLKLGTIPKSILTPDEIAEHHNFVCEILQDIDDEVIIAQRNLFQEYKLFALSLKYGEKLPVVACDDTIALRLQNVRSFKASGFTIKLEFLHIEKDQCEIEGVYYSIPSMIPDFSIFAEVNGIRYAATDYRDRKPVIAWDTVIQKRTAFRIRIPLAEPQTYQIRFLCQSGISCFYLKAFQFGSFFPVSNTYRNNYYISGEWMVQARGTQLVLSPAEDKRGHWKRLCKEMWKRNKVGDRHAVLMRIALAVLRPFKPKQLWLISDRVGIAGDNGEAFFRYMRKNHPEVCSVFTISKECTDYKRMKKVGPVVNVNGRFCKLLLLLSDYIISSAADQNVHNPFSRYIEPYRNLTANIKFIFLQHGVTKDDISGWLCRSNKNIQGFVTSARPEYHSILTGNYEYDESKVWLTGMPRFDRLENGCSRKWITIMPTWRRYLMSDANPNTGTRAMLADSDKSEYVRFYSGLVTNQKLIQKAKDLGYQLKFFPHPAMQYNLDSFDKDPNVDYLGIETSYRDIYAFSDLILSDYSSAVFDFAYLRKPIIYAQFDADEFFAGDHVYTKGYFDYERDGFGEVEYTLEDTVDRIIEYMENGCRLKDKYRQRIDDFFAFNDKNNCQRVYEKIIELDNRNASN